MDNRKKFDRFLLKSKKKHGNKYNYSLVDYHGSFTKIKIICVKHGMFEQIPSSHLQGNGCPKCGRIKKTTVEFINEAKEIHGDKYDYSITKYFNDKEKIKIICKKHGIFEQRASKHLFGQGCPKCVGLNKTTDDFIFKVKQIYNNKYDYSLSVYENVKKKIKIICVKHGVFEKTPDAHMRGNLMGGGCPKCKDNNRYHKLGNENFIERAKLIHCNKYDYSNVNYINAKTNVNIMCDKHGVFKQQPTNHLNGAGCPICNLSKGELKIKKYLDIHNIEYIKEKIFNDCKNIFHLPFDFYLPNQNILIEYDGLQHFKSIKYFGGDNGFEARKINDEIKNNFAKNNNINLLRIKYNEINNIEKILLKFIN